MAKMKENQVQAPEESMVQTPEQPGPQADAPSAPAPASVEPESPAPAPEEAAPAATPASLYSLEELASVRRIPGWQAAALHKLMGWEPGKRVSETEYVAALARLKNRRLGG